MPTVVDYLTEGQRLVVGSRTGNMKPDHINVLAHQQNLRQSGG